MPPPPAGAAITCELDERTADHIAGCLDRLIGEPQFSRAAVGVAAELAAMPEPAELVEAIESLAVGDLSRADPSLRRRCSMAGHVHHRFRRAVAPYRLDVLVEHVERAGLEHGFELGPHRDADHPCHDAALAQQAQAGSARPMVRRDRW